MWEKKKAVRFVIHRLPFIPGSGERRFHRTLETLCALLIHGTCHKKFLVFVCLSVLFVTGPYPVNTLCFVNTRCHKKVPGKNQNAGALFKLFITLETLCGLLIHGVTKKVPGRNQNEQQRLLSNYFKLETVVLVVVANSRWGEVFAPQHKTSNLK